MTWRLFTVLVFFSSCVGNSYRHQDPALVDLAEDLLIHPTVQTYLADRAREPLEAYACLVGKRADTLVGVFKMDVAHAVYEPRQIRTARSVKVLELCPKDTVAWWHSHLSGCSLSDGDKAHTRVKGFIWAVITTSRGDFCKWRVDNLDVPR